MSEQYNWQVGELCKAVYDNIGEGIIYRVTGVRKLEDRPTATVQLDLLPVFGAFADIKRRRKRSLGAGWCTPLSLVDLGHEYMQLGLFIQEEAKSRGA